MIAVLKIIVSVIIFYILDTTFKGICEGRLPTKGLGDCVRDKDPKFFWLVVWANILVSIFIMYFVLFSPWK